MDLFLVVAAAQYCQTSAQLAKIDEPIPILVERVKQKVKQGFGTLVILFAVEPAGCIDNVEPRFDEVRMIDQPVLVRCFGELFKDILGGNASQLGNAARFC